jgi:hypothetical protein
VNAEYQGELVRIHQDQLAREAADERLAHAGRRVRESLRHRMVAWFSALRVRPGREGLLVESTGEPIARTPVGAVLTRRGESARADCAELHVA